MNKLTALITMICFLSIAGQAQLLIKNSTGHVLMEVDGNANVTIGSASQTGDLTTDNIVVNDGLTYAAGAANGHVLRSNASGAASWGLENQRLSLSGNTLGISDGTGTQLNTVSLPTGSDNQQLSISGHTLSLERGGSVTLPDNINDADHNIGNEYQNLGSSKSGESVTVSITNGSNTSFSIQDDDHNANNEKPLAGNATTISGAAVRNVDVNVDNKSIVIESNQLKALPLLRYPGTGPRSVLVLFDENGPIQVQYKDGVPNYYDCSGGDPAHGWNTASSGDYQIVNWNDPFSSYDGNGVHLEKELLSPTGKHYRAISVRMGGWRCSMANDHSARMYAAQSSDAYLQEIAGQGLADDIDADGLVTLDDNGGVYVMSQFQQRTDRDLRLILFTVNSYIGEQ
ncbi:hypothetical protein GF407_13765 [candidate division KSB1 bacterium]|nr:hypothetical protein [candidate division KSB1 bacterium]